MPQDCHFFYTCSQFERSQMRSGSTFVYAWIRI
ncbi:Adenine nucleotide alpha hydrolase-like superfamily protein [Zea mays]|uniref:Adenine nucleotide alpha hydrolase-like superfamily protein n=1 Tax=Zea mays TaxID=4577 RepID=A0A1D6G7R4_MAIZE|nr:Adenine nucleotide alpha hydrolase-like superfamily protein [Zea mays]